MNSLSLSLLIYYPPPSALLFLLWCPQPRNSFFIFVLDVAGVHIVLHRRLSFITEDKDSEFVGIEVHTVR